jgi:FkbM family methyltransferase
MNTDDIKYYNLLGDLKHINKDSIVLDIGANIGDVTNYLYEKFMPSIYSYEPNIVCYNYMIKRFKNFSKIKIYNSAVSNFTGKSYLYFHIKAKGINDSNYIQGATMRPEKDDIDLEKKIQIKCINIKNILESFVKIDLIKIDVEGSEYSIMPEIIKNKNKIKMVICETHGNPNGKKIYNSNRTKLIMKNEAFKQEHKKLIDKLKEMDLYGSWFQEWY